MALPSVRHTPVDRHAPQFGSFGDYTIMTPKHSQAENISSRYSTPQRHSSPKQVSTQFPTQSAEYAQQPRPNDSIYVKPGLEQPLHARQRESEALPPPPVQYLAPLPSISEALRGIDREADSAGDCLATAPSSPRPSHPSRIWESVQPSHVSSRTSQHRDHLTTLPQPAVTTRPSSPSTRSYDQKRSVSDRASFDSLPYQRHDLPQTPSTWSLSHAHSSTSDQRSMYSRPSISSTFSTRHDSMLAPQSKGPGAYAPNIDSQKTPAPPDYHKKSTGEAYGSTIKRHLDDFEYEAALNDIADSSSRINEFSEYHRGKAHSAQRSSSLADVPVLQHVDEMLRQGVRLQNSLGRLRDVVIAQQIEAAETSKEQSFRSFAMEEAYAQEDSSAADYAGSNPKKRRGRAAPPGKCHSCNRVDTPEWRRGPDGARTLCNACGLHYAKLTRKAGTTKPASNGSNLRPKDEQ